MGIVVHATNSEPEDATFYRRESWQLTSCQYFIIGHDATCLVAFHLRVWS